MDRVRVLWIDDEIDLLKPHVMFLEKKGYEVLTMNNGRDAIDALRSEAVDIVFLDEQMPGMSGLEVLTEIKTMLPSLPVVMVTKSEEEQIMEEALGSKISDYLIKPVNPGQIILAIKKQLAAPRLEGEKSSMTYQQEFRSIGMELSAGLTYQEWERVYKKMTYWELELPKAGDAGLLEILKAQKQEANLLFSKYIEKNYIDFINGRKGENDFEMSHTVLKQKLFPLLSDDVPVFMLVIDNLRYDHWKIMQGVLERYVKVISDSTYMSILPSVTHYARNSLFAGLLPSEIERKYPQYWVSEDSGERKNQHEKELLEEYMKRYGKEPRVTFNKVLNHGYGMKMLDYLPRMLQTPLNVIIYNFVDMLSHASTEVELLREMSSEEESYRSLVLSWVEHSPLVELLKHLVGQRAIIVLTTDHGSIRISNPVRVKGDREASVNLRYKVGRNMEFDPKQVFYVRYPADIFLPKVSMTASFIFCRENDFFVYPNNYNQYVGYYKDTIQHGGISMEEMMVPFAVMRPR